MPVSGTIKMGGELYEEILKRIEEPVSEGTNGQVLTTDGNGGRTWTTVQGGGSAVIDDTAGAGDTDKAWSADKLTTEFDNVVAVQDTTPTAPETKIWFPETQPQSVQVATYSELQSLVQRVSDLEYVPIEINTFSVSPNLVEIGITRTTATLSYTMNRDATQMKLDNESIQDTSATGTIYLNDLSVTSNKTWTLQATDERKSLLGEWESKTATMTFTNKVCYGAAEIPQTLDDIFINSLPTRTLSTGKVRNFSATAGANEYIWYALPSSYGACTFTVGGFSGGFSLVATQNHVNESGSTAEYYIYRSDNANLGSVTVTVS